MEETKSMSAWRHEPRHRMDHTPLNLTGKPTGHDIGRINWTHIPREASVEARDEASEYESAHLTMVMLRQSIEYAKLSAEMYAHIRDERHKKDSRAVRAMADGLHQMFWQEGCARQEKLCDADSEDYEDAMAPIFSKIFSAVQMGIRQHHVGADMSEQEETAKTYAGCAHALMNLALEWRHKYDRYISVRYGLSRVVSNYLKALKSMSGGDYETKQRDVRRCLDVLLKNWREVARIYNEISAFK